MARVYFFYPSGPRGEAGEDHRSGRALILEKNLGISLLASPKKEPGNSYLGESDYQ
jgi:hypothetical protein